jgi:predicted ATP-binding protein involved in virulence
MRIDRLTVQNFKKYAEQTFALHPQFTLLVGENGAGKTSVLDALAVAVGLWHKAAPGSGWRNILTEEIRLTPVTAGDRVVFKQHLPTAISVFGSIGSVDGLSWTRMIRQGGTRTTNAEAKQAEKAIWDLLRQSDLQQAPLPVLAYYGAGRAWLPSNKRPSGTTSRQKLQRFNAYRNCLDTRIRDRELNEWFLFEIAAANGHGKERPGLRAVRQAVLDCVPGADGLWYDSDRKEIVLSIGEFQQPFYNLSAGQRMMLALVADIAIKAVTLNSYLLGSGQPGADDPSQLLRLTPGVVLIDELDAHLHPRWQRQVAQDLKKNFPSIQFVCTSHSPQIIGELSPEEIRLLDDTSVSIPPRSLGIDSNRILEELMKTSPRNTTIEKELNRLSVLIDQENFEDARAKIACIEKTLGSDDPEISGQMIKVGITNSTTF